MYISYIVYDRLTTKTQVRLSSEPRSSVQDERYQDIITTTPYR